jgi:hypothetical protein
MIRSVLLGSLCLLTLGLSACGEQSVEPQSASTDDQVGKVASAPMAVLSTIDGDVFVLSGRAEQWSPGRVGKALGTKDRIKTTAGSHAAITFLEGSTIDLEADTEIALDELDTIGTARKIRIKQEVGQTLSRVKKLVDAASRYEIETRAAVAAVRGTTMYVSVARDGVTVVGNLEGLVSVFAQGVEVILPEGTRTTVNPGRLPNAPQPWPTSPPPTPLRPLTIAPPPTSAPSLTGLEKAVNSFGASSSNPNGNWAYGWMSADSSVFKLYTSHSTDAFSGYAPTGLVNWFERLGKDRTPCVWINTGQTAYGVPNGWLALHPGPGSEPSVVRWTSPIAGGVHVTGEFLPGDSGRMTVAIRHNNQEIWKAADSGRFDLAVIAGIGDTIDFMAYGGYWSGNTPVSITVNY